MIIVITGLGGVVIIVVSVLVIRVIIVLVYMCRYYSFGYISYIVWDSGVIIDV